MKKKQNHGSMYYELSKKYQNDLIENLGKLVAIPSVYDDKTADKENPFGVEVSNSLKFVEELAKKDGFEVNNYKNMVVEIVAGEGDKNVTILAHADVVPAGNTGWQQYPFEMIDKKGILSGRGVADDKGPLLAAYYGMKILRDNYLIDGYKVRFIVGGNEESGSKGVEYYFHKLKKEEPTYGFSPDADYPLIYAEKGIIGFHVQKDFVIPGVYSIKGGVASNSVIEKCTVVMNQNLLFIKYLKQNKIPFTFEMVDSNKMEVSFEGKAAHGASPQLGVNAGMMAIEVLSQYLECPDLRDAVKYFKDVYGRGIGAYVSSKEMGESSMNMGILKYENNSFEAVLNYRYVQGYKEKDLCQRVKNTLVGYDVEVAGTAPLLYFPKDSVLVSTLLKVYQEETGDLASEPLAIGGGTYAKETNNVVAFGMEMPDWDSHMHSPGESLRKDDLFKSVGIYAHAIHELGKKCWDEN